MIALVIPVVFLWASDLRCVVDDSVKYSQSGDASWQPDGLVLWMCWPTIIIMIVNKPDIVVIDRLERRAMIVDTTVPHDENLVKAEKDKQFKHLDLAREVVDMWDCKAEDYFYNPLNGTRATLSGIAAYRSALTLDWLAAEDMRQRELASAFETEPAPPSRTITTDCMGYAKPASGKVARLMLELLKNLEGDDGTIVSDLITALVRTKLLVETAMLDAEPDLDSLVKTPGVMMGEPHTTFPRILSMCWMAVTDPVTTKKFGWCPINRVNRYLRASKPIMIAKQMRALEPVIARARFIMEGFIQHVTPLNMYQRKLEHNVTPLPKPTLSTQTEIIEVTRTRTYTTRPTRTPNAIRQLHLAMAPGNTIAPLPPLMEPDSLPIPNLRSEETSTNPGNSLSNLPHFLLATIVIVL